MAAGYTQRARYGMYRSIRLKEAKLGRSALVISYDRNNEFAETETVIPITSSVSRIYPFEALLTCSSSGLKNDSKAKCNQIRTVSKERLLNLLGAISSEELRQVEKGLLIHLGYEIA